MTEQWTPILSSKNWTIFWVDPLNYALVSKKNYLMYVNRHKKSKDARLSRVIEGWYFPIFAAIKALLYREMEDKVIGNKLYRKTESLVSDLSKAIDRTSKEIEVSL